MKMTDLRAKARAIFGSAIAEPMPNQPNGAKALQERANARPIPTYKVGGVVKKQAGGRMMAPPPARPRGGSPEADDVLITTPRGRRMEEELRRREAEKERAMAAKRARADKLLGIPAQKKGGKAGCYADGGKVMDERLAARMAAGNYKKGGKAKDGLAVMIAIGKPMKEKATGERYASKKAMAKHEAAESAGMERMERMKAMKKMNGGPANVRDMNMEAGKVTQKMAAGGAGKVRKGQAPIKRAAGGAAKVRKGVMKGC